MALGTTCSACGRWMPYGQMRLEFTPDTAFTAEERVWTCADEAACREAELARDAVWAAEEDVSTPAWDWAVQQPWLNESPARRLAREARLWCWAAGTLLRHSVRSFGLLRGLRHAALWGRYAVEIDREAKAQMRQDVQRLEREEAA